MDYYYRMDRNENRLLTSNNENIDEVSGFFVMCATDTCGIPFVSEEDEKEWQINALRKELPNISRKNAEYLVNKHSKQYA